MSDEIYEHGKTPVCPDCLGEGVIFDCGWEYTCYCCQPVIVFKDKDKDDE